MKNVRTKLASVVVSLFCLVAGLVAVAGPAQAGSTSNPNYNAGGWATVSLNFTTTKINAGTFRLNYATVCMTPGDNNVTQLKPGNIAVRGSGGALIVNMYVPAVGRHSCVNVVPNPSSTNVGSGAGGTYSAVVNINGWVPYPDYGFSFCRGVVNSGGC